MSTVDVKHYGSGSVPQRVDLRIKRGDGNRYHEFVHNFLAAEINKAEWTARVKVPTEPGSGTAKILLRSNVETTQVVNEDNLTTVYWATSDTTALMLNNSGVNELDLEHDLQLTLNDGNPVTVWFGDYEVDPDVTE